jgi:hypothetical protein
MRFLTRLLSRLKRFHLSSQPQKHDSRSNSPSVSEEKNPTPDLTQRITELAETIDIFQPTSSNTGLFINLPGEVRNLIYKFTLNTSFSPNQLPDTHCLPSGSSLALTCRQIYHEVHQMIDSNTLVYALHTMRIRFFQQLPPERLKLMKAVILPESRMGDSWIRYHDWRNGIYQCVVESLCASKFHPTTLIFCTDHRRSQMSWDVIGVSNEARDAGFANALKDLRFALSILHTVRTVYLIDVGAPYVLATRDFYANMFEKFFPTDEDAVRRITRGFTSLYYHGTIDGCEKWVIERGRQTPKCGDTQVGDGSGIEDEDQFMLKEGSANWDCTPCFRLARIYPPESPPCEVAVHIFANWPDFCKAYDGPYRSPKRDGNPTQQGTATKYNMRQQSWHLGQDV